MPAARIVSAARLLALVTVLMVVAPASTDEPLRATSPPPLTAPAVPVAPQRTHVVALGDSVTSGYSCDCTPFPDLYAAAVARLGRTTPSVSNLARAGLDTAGLLDQLGDPRGEAAGDLAHADIVLVTIGANDFADARDDVVSGRCPASASDPCLDPVVETLATRFDRLLHRIRALAARSPRIVVTGYWNVFEDGSVARRTFSAAGIRSTRWLTADVDRTLREVALRSGGTYVDLTAAFSEPPDGPDSLLAEDGDHPNAAGHAAIARALLAAGLPTR